MTDLDAVGDQPRDGKHERRGCDERDQSEFVMVLHTVIYRVVLVVPVARKVACDVLRGHVSLCTVPSRRGTDVC